MKGDERRLHYENGVKKPDNNPLLNFQSLFYFFLFTSIMKNIRQQ